MSLLSPFQEEREKENSKKDKENGTQLKQKSNLQRTRGEVEEESCALIFETPETIAQTMYKQGHNVVLGLLTNEMTVLHVHKYLIGHAFSPLRNKHFSGHYLHTPTFIKWPQIENNGNNHNVAM